MGDLCRRRLGFAMLEAALMASIMLPAALLALALWNHLSTLNQLSELITNELAAVEARSIALRNAADGTEGQINVPALRSAVDKLLNSSSSRLVLEMGQGAESFHVEAVLIDRTPSSTDGSPLNRVLYSSTDGGLSVQSAFGTPEKITSLCESLPVTRQPSILTDKSAGIGLAISLKPQVDFVSSVLGSDSIFAFVQSAKLIDLRGEYIWQ